MHFVERVRRLLILEDDQELSSGLADALQPHAEAVHIAPTLAAARRILKETEIDGILLDISLPDGQSDSLLEQIQGLRPFPHIVALSGSADPEQAFRLAQGGVRAFVPKPVDLERLVAVWTQTLAQAPALESFVRGSVGRVPLADVETSVREAMVDEALARAKGSRRGAARLLQISRQLLQHSVRGR